MTGESILVTAESAPLTCPPGSVEEFAAHFSLTGLDKIDFLDAGLGYMVSFPGRLESSSLPGESYPPSEIILVPAGRTESIANLLQLWKKKTANASDSHDCRCDPPPSGSDIVRE